MKRTKPLRADPEKVRQWQARSRAQRAQNSRLSAPEGLRRGNGPRKGSGPQNGPSRKDARWGRAKVPKRWREAKGRCCARCLTKRGPFHLHHLVYAQHVEAAGGDVWDPRNGLTLCEQCHAGQHNRTAVLDLALWPVDALIFAVETLGHGAAFEYIRRYYRAAAGDLTRALGAA